MSERRIDERIRNHAEPVPEFDVRALGEQLEERRSAELFEGPGARSTTTSPPRGWRLLLHAAALVMVFSLGGVVGSTLENRKVPSEEPHGQTAGDRVSFSPPTDVALEIQASGTALQELLGGVPASELDLQHRQRVEEAVFALMHGLAHETSRLGGASPHPLSQRLEELIARHRFAAAGLAAAAPNVPGTTSTNPDAGIAGKARGGS